MTMGLYEQYIAKSRYARYIPELQRRETWDETVSRYVTFWDEKGLISDDEHAELFEAIHDLKVMPSMRALMTAGEALDRDNVAGFNCSYIPIDSVRSFDELLYILMCGTGVGFSVERQYVNKLPCVAEELYDTDTTITVADSKIGWAKAYRELLSLLYSGQVPKWDVSRVRPSGATLKTFGGRASGPEPLVDLFRFTIEVFRAANGRKLSSIECHDLCCKIAQVVVVGGVRRSALISLSNLTDDRIRRAKHGQWYDTHPHRGLANNSVCYTEKPDFEAFVQEWTALHESKSGERGMFSRVASKRQAGRNGRRDTDHEFGTNPCSEIILRPYQFCNLSEVVVRHNDTRETLAEKVRLATILGTLQSTLTNFRYLRKVWQQNTEEERLLGVSMTGIMDCRLTNGAEGYEETAELLDYLRGVAIETNAEWADRLGIPRSTAITCVKPSGTVSQLVDSASGIHPRFSPNYIRRVRASEDDPLCTLLKDGGVPWEHDEYSPRTLVFSFPMEAPADSVCVADVGAMQQLALWKVYQDHWCEHKPSITVYYTDKEFLEIGQWLYNNFDDVSGVSFLPYAEHSYKQAPYEEITKEAYDQMVNIMPSNISWDITESDDTTEGAQTLACTNGSCEL